MNSDSVLLYNQSDWSGQFWRSRRYVLWGSSDEEGIEINNDLYSPAGEFWNQLFQSQTPVLTFSIICMARLEYPLHWNKWILFDMQLVKCLTPHSGNLTCYWTSPSSTHVGHVHPFSIAIHVSLTMISWSQMFPKSWKYPNHPTFDHVSVETHGCGTNISSIKNLLMGFPIKHIFYPNPLLLLLSLLLGTRMDPLIFTIILLLHITYYILLHITYTYTYVYIYLYVYVYILYMLHVHVHIHIHKYNTFTVHILICTYTCT